jgi:hypothetical protein
MMKSSAHIHPLDSDVLKFWQQNALDQRAAFDAIAAYLS